MEVLRTAITDWIRRKKGKPFSPLDVIRQMYAQSWECFIPEILEEMMQMHREELIRVILEGKQVCEDHIPTGKEEILPVSKPAGKKYG
ncbi:MAG: hypothetical protein LPK25_03880 [Cyclobacteriaceae bacterium]|nr:hypothetical protein [Cyclobacteriaceae bacterium]MDX5465902.1 hypothetical protein [Cyclobacteriaceae bacterium]